MNICPKAKKPQGQLVILPPRKSMENPCLSCEDYSKKHDCCDAYGGRCNANGYYEAMKKVYSSAKPVDIDKLADAIGTEIDPWSIRIVATIKQAIESYLEELK